MDPNTTCFVMLSKNFKNAKEKDLNGNWYISEKHDGIRAIWDPTSQKLLTRAKRSFNYVPQWFIDLMPKDIPLEGEILVPGKPFRYFSGITVMKDYDTRWEESVFHVFDVPVSDMTFHDRKILMTDVVNKINSKHVVCVEFELIENLPQNLDTLHSRFNNLISQGKEGLMMIKQDNVYQPKRVGTILKYKKEHEGECIVIDYLEGTGKYKGILGKLRCRLADGKEFNMGSGFVDSQRKCYKFKDGKFIGLEEPENIPKIGDMITYSCMEITNTGVPRMPIYKCIRTDIPKIPTPKIKTIKSYFNTN